MLNYNSLITGTKTSKDINEYFNSFFVKVNFKKYQYDDNLNKDEIKALKILFDDKKDLFERIDEVLRINPLCLEAIYTYSLIGETTYVHLRFESYYKQKDNYADLSSYQKQVYLEVLSLYVEFLLDIQNISYAIRVQKMIIKLTNNVSNVSRNRLSFMYAALEDYKSAYELYLENNFDAYDYLLLIVSLLKNDEQIKAKEVLFDMLDNIKDSEYIDHIWDLDENNDFFKIVDDCLNEINAIPMFFSWANEAIKNRV